MNIDEKFDALVKLATKDTNKASEIVAKSFYKGNPSLTGGNPSYSSSGLTGRLTGVSRFCIDSLNYTWIPRSPDRSRGQASRGMTYRGSSFFIEALPITEWLRTI